MGDATVYDKIRGDRRFVTGTPPDLDILVWAPRAKRVSEASAQSRRIFDQAAQRGLHLAIASLPVHLIDVGDMQRDREMIICLRSVLMKPEHREWTDRIWTILDEATQAVLGKR